MFYFLFKRALSMIVLLMVMSVIVHTLGGTQLPNPALQGFIDGCQAQQQPCWQGIVPGITAIDEAKIDLQKAG